MQNHVGFGIGIAQAAFIGRSRGTDEFEPRRVVHSLENDARSVLLDLTRLETRDTAQISHLERLEQVTDHLYDVSVALSSPKPKPR